jgi:hypothetical protein
VAGKDSLQVLNKHMDSQQGIGQGLTTPHHKNPVKVKGKVVPVLN